MVGLHNPSWLLCQNDRLCVVKSHILHEVPLGTHTGCVAEHGGSRCEGAEVALPTKEPINGVPFGKPILGVGDSAMRQIVNMMDQHLANDRPSSDGICK